MMGAAMLKRHRFVRSLWALYRLVVSSITFVRHLYVGESGAALVVIVKITKMLLDTVNTYSQNSFLNMGLYRDDICT